MPKVKQISMESDTFDELKQDMTVEINKLLNNMQNFGAEKATVKVSLDITLEEKELDDVGNAIVPKFEHKVTTTVQIKNEKKGELDGEYILEADGHGGHILKPLSSQMDMFEESVE